MKNFLCIVFFLSGCLFISCQNTREIYIVRHAEKSNEPAINPHLTIQGKVRAETLKFLLKDKNIKAVFSTQTARTIETAEPLSRLINIPIQYYGNDTLPAFVQRVIHLKKNALIVGHSNTVVFMLDGLGVEHTIASIPDNDYDNMFIIKTKNGCAKKIKETTYGMVSPPVK
jgi:phosphohistidine phosphatase SixA